MSALLLHPAAGSMSALFGGSGSRRSHAPHLDDGLVVLGAVVMDLARVMDDIASGRHRDGAVRIELLAGPHPPGTGQYDEEAVVRMKVRPAHVSWQPLDTDDVGPGLAGVAEQHRRLIRSGRLTHLMSDGVLKSTAVRSMWAAFPKCRGVHL